MGAGGLRIVDVESARAEALAAALNARHGSGPFADAEPDPARAVAGATGVVHATPVGMVKRPGMAIAAALLRPSLWLSEVVYVPIETGLLQAARSLGCRTVDGGTMAVGQAVGAFELFTGMRADAARMERHFRQLLAAG